MKESHALYTVDPVTHICSLSFVIQTATNIFVFEKDKECHNLFPLENLDQKAQSHFASMEPLPMLKMDDNILYV